GNYVNPFLVYPFTFPPQGDARFREGQRTKLPDRMHLTRSNHKVLRFRVLQDHPHALYVILCISPVTHCIQVTQVKLVLHPLSNSCCRDGDLPGNESLTPSLTLVIEQDP